MLKIKNLKVSTESDVSILNGLNLAVGPEVHAIMGPNGLEKARLPRYCGIQNILL